MVVCRVTDIRSDERLGDETRDTVDDSGRGDFGARGDDTRRFQAEAAGEDRQAAQHNALGLGEQLVTPVQCRLERLMPRQRRPTTPGEQTEPIVQARCEGLYTQRRAAGRRQLDRQRDAVESPADCCCDSCSAPVRREVRIRRPRSRYEQLDRAVSQQLIHIVGTFSRHSERWHPIQVLSFHSQRLTTSRQHAYRRIGMQKHLGHAGRCVDHVLAIVEHEHQLLPAERIRDTFGRHSARGEFEPKRRGHGDRDKLGIGERRELGDPGSIGKFRQKMPRDLDAEVRLADPSLTPSG